LLIQRLGKGANVPDASIAKRSSRRDQRWPLLSSPDATFIPTVPQAWIIRSYPRSRYVVSRQIADARCLRRRGRRPPVAQLAAIRLTDLLSLCDGELMVVDQTGGLTIRLGLKR
jgi:hypothetical protein